VVVRAPGQRLPDLPADTLVRDDDTAGLGPLQGLAVGLAAVADQADTAYVSSTDLPFLHVAFVRRVLAGFGPGTEVVLPIVGGFRQPLAAGYRTSLAPLVAELVADGQLRPAFLFERCRVVRLDEATLVADPDLAASDPGLESVVNVNEPADYAAALARPAPLVTVFPGPRTVRAATVSEAAAGRPFTLATVNGVPIRDGSFPLVAGDTVHLP
jgi:molybdopterin-guanine dinucleotide biosynthesis protein A